MNDELKSKIVGLVDCDSFYASCEKVFRPDWTHKPVVVLSNNDGCVVARSAEAKALDIPMGEPYFRLRAFAEARGVVVRSANYALYGDMSRRVMQTLGRWTPEIDAYSIDEAFLDLTGLFPSRRLADHESSGCPTESLDIHELRRRALAWPEGPALGEIPSSVRERLETIAQDIVTTTRKWTGIPVSLGLAPTRTLAKLASRLAKDEYQRTGKKYALLFEKEERIAALRRTPIGEVWGVGRKLREVFEKSGFKTAYDLAKCDPKYIRSSFTIEQERTVRELRGELIFDATSSPTPRRSMRVSRSFGTPLTTLEELEQPVSTFASRLSAKLRKHGLVATGLYVTLETSRFAQPEERRFDGKGINFARPTNLTPEILSTALRLLRQGYASGYNYKRAGIVALELVPESVAGERLYLFEPDPTQTPERRSRDLAVSKLLDTVNARFGKNALFMASEGVDRPWSPNADFVSPCYTTDWDALPVAE